MSLLLAVLLQVGPAPGVGTDSPSQLPPEMRDRRPRHEVPARTAPPPPVLPPAKEQECSPGIAADAPTTEDYARKWRDGAAGEDRALADLCLGMALSEQQSWSEAETAFVDGRDAAKFQTPIRARLGSMAANAALAQGAAERALTQLDVAATDLAGERSGPLPVAMALDRARALVALRRLPEAETALTEARTLAPGNAEAWLLSATLSRRLNNLPEAQARIEKAAQLLPIDPEIGLEAGVIAMLSGREDAARKSWQSVIAAAPQSPSADTARGYLKQIGASPAPAANPQPANPQLEGR
jgi:tetratricopeptide (TPR) repeat protein